MIFMKFVNTLNNPILVVFSAQIKSKKLKQSPLIFILYNIKNQ